MSTPGIPLADGHADSLMWNRDLTVRQRRGQVDFPRLVEAGVRIQSFTVVTRGMPFVDGMRALAAFQGWPATARRGPWARCLYQVERMHALAGQSGDTIRVATSGAELEENVAAARVTAVLGIEGGQALESRPERVGELAAKGVRFMSLTHLSRNELGGSSSPLQGDQPLTPLGHEVLAAMVTAGMAVDVAHASRRTFEDLSALPAARLFCSHTGIAGAHPIWRNLDDAQLRTVAGRGGVVGVIFANVFLGGGSLDDVVRHVEHALDVVGEDAVAFGSDFDGMVKMPPELRDVTGLPRLVEALARRRPAAVVEKVAWLNWRRFWRENLG